MSRCCCEKELTSQSEFSPGKVDDPEPIVLAAVEPITFRDDSLHKINHKQLKSGDLSVCRAKYITGSEARTQTAEKLLKNDASRVDHGFVWAHCVEIRDITLASLGVGAFCVIDDALEGFAAHAHLGYSDVNDTKNERQSARGDLHSLFIRRGLFPIWRGDPFLPEQEPVTLE